MKVAIGSDHHGIALKSTLQLTITSTSKTVVEWIDCGCNASACDYPDQAFDVVRLMQTGKAEVGVLLCSTGVGMAIAANRFSGIYAALVWTPEIARLSRQHDNANILVLPADFVTPADAIEIVHAWLEADFLEGRHRRRIDKIDTFGGVRTDLKKS